MNCSKYSIINIVNQYYYHNPILIRKYIMRANN